MAFQPVYKYLKNTTASDIFHNNSGELFEVDDLHLIDEIELYRLCDLQMRDLMGVSGAVSGALEYYESVSGTDDGNDVIAFDYPESWDRLCENAFGTWFRGNNDNDRTISGYKQFFSFDSQRAIEESFPAYFETVSGVPVLREQTTRNVEFDSPIVSVSGVPGENRAIITVDPSQSGLGKDATYQFFNNGSNIKDKWLDHEGSNITCFDTPGCVANNSKMRFITFTNLRDSSSIDIMVYRNGIDPADLVFTWLIRDCRRAWDATLLDQNIAFSAGDSIRVFAGDPGPGGGGPQPTKAVIKIGMINTDDFKNDGCIEFDEDT